MWCKLNVVILRSLKQTKNQPGWPKTREYLEANLQRYTNEILDRTDPAQLHELRGRAKQVKEFLELMDNLDEKLKNAEKTGP